MTDINSTPQPAAIGTRMCKAALGLAALGLRVHPCDHVVPAGDGTFESSKAKWQRKLARRDGTEVKPVLSPGKLPHLKGWQKATTNDPERVRAYWASREEGGFPKANIGVATGPDSDLFVLDIDGEEGKCSLDNLIGRYGALPTTVTVITQSGGTHYWFRWPESLDLRNTASALGSGIDTRGDGGFVIAPPSRGITGNEYAYADGCSPDDVEIAHAPQWLIEIAFEATKGREKSEGTSQVVRGRGPAATPAALSPEEMMRLPELRVHLDQIGDGEGRKGFDAPINSAICAYFARQGVGADKVAIKNLIRFTASMAPMKPGRTNLDRYLSDEYLDLRIEDAQAFVKKKTEEAEARARFEFVNERELVDELNTKAAAVWDGDKLMILVDAHEPIRWMKVADARNAFAPCKLMIVDEKKKKLKPRDGFDVWLKSEFRREFTSKVFDPSGNCDLKAYNTYLGLAMKPKGGDWTLMQAHLFENVCRGDLVSYRALLSWIAQLLQEPARKLGSAVVLRGVKGCGKSIVAFWLSRIIGDRHSTKVTNPRHLTGNFNKHFSEAILVVLEEGFWAGDHVADGVLKDFITSDSIMIESKGIDAGQARNFTRLMITSNASRVAPATRGERRFLVLDVSPARAKDQDYFGALDRQMREGGAEAMLHDLLGFEFDERVLRDPPRTAGLVDQIVEGLPADERWWFTMLYEGNVPGRPDIAWPDRGALAVSMEDLRESFNEFVPRFKGAQAAASTVGKFVREMVPDLPALTRPKRLDGSRPRHVSLPSLDDLRSGFAERYGVTFDGEAKSAPAITWADCLEARLLFMQMPVTVIDRAGDVTGVPVNDDKPIADVA